MFFYEVTYLLIISHCLREKLYIPAFRQKVQKMTTYCNEFTEQIEEKNYKTKTEVILLYKSGKAWSPLVQNFAELHYWGL